MEIRTRTDNKPGLAVITEKGRFFFLKKENQWLIVRFEVDKEEHDEPIPLDESQAKEGMLIATAGSPKELRDLIDSWFETKEIIE